MRALVIGGAVLAALVGVLEAVLRWADPWGKDGGSW